MSRDDASPSTVCSDWMDDGEEAVACGFRGGFWVFREYEREVEGSARGLSDSRRGRVSILWRRSLRGCGEEIGRDVWVMMFEGQCKAIMRRLRMNARYMGTRR